MMRPTTRLFSGSTLVTVAAVVVLLLATPTALANAAPAMLVFAMQPTTTQLNTVMSPVVVDVENPAGQLVSSFNGPVTLTYAPGSNRLNALEPTGNTVNARKGVATFPALTFSAVGFGFKLQASAGGVTSDPSTPFDIVTQLVHCQSGQACQSETVSSPVSSPGTSGFAVSPASTREGVLTATGGGFPDLSCTSMVNNLPIGGVVSFTVTNRSLTITMMLAKDLVQLVPGPGTAHFNICWGSGSKTPFITKDGTSVFNPANNEDEGLLADCPVPVSPPSPCITSRNKTNAGVVVITVSAPPGDPHSSF